LRIAGGNGGELDHRVRAGYAKAHL
jgi:hypothetical protein